jgi:hypothetical protein
LSPKFNKHVERPGEVVNHEDYDDAPGPSREGSVTAQRAGIVSGASPGPEDGVLTTIEDEDSEEESMPIQTNASAKNVGKTEIRDRKEERGLEDAGIKDDEQTKPQVEGITVGGKLVSHRGCFSLVALT